MFARCVLVASVCAHMFARNDIEKHHVQCTLNKTNVISKNEGERWVVSGIMFVEGRGIEMGYYTSYTWRQTNKQTSALKAVIFGCIIFYFIFCLVSIGDDDKIRKSIQQSASIQQTLCKRMASIPFYFIPTLCKKIDNHTSAWTFQIKIVLHNKNVLYLLYVYVQYKMSTYMCVR